MTAKFEEVLAALKEGEQHRVLAWRTGWNGIQRGLKMFIFKDSAPHLNHINGTHSKQKHKPFITFHNGREYNPGWMPSIWDMWEEDWMFIHLDSAEAFQSFIKS